MNKKILFIIIICLLFININVLALECHYSDGNANPGDNEVNELIIINNGDSGLQFQVSGGKNIVNKTLSPIYLDNFYEILQDETKACPSIVYFYVDGDNITLTDNESTYNSNSPASTIKGHFGISSGGGGASFGSSTCKAMNEFKVFFEEKINKPVKIISVILFVVLTTVEYAKVIFADDASPKKANTRTMKRAVALLLIFFSYEIVSFIMLIIGASIDCKFIF